MASGILLPSGAGRGTASPLSPSMPLPPPPPPPVSCDGRHHLFKLCQIRETGRFHMETSRHPLFKSRTGRETIPAGLGITPYHPRVGAWGVGVARTSEVVLAVSTFQMVNCYSSWLKTGTFSLATRPATSTGSQATTALILLENPPSTYGAHVPRKTLQDPGQKRQTDQ